MVDISNALTAGTIIKYREKEFARASNSYFSENGKAVGIWAGKIAQTFGLEGQPITKEQFERLALGQHPITGEQSIRHRTSDGSRMAHRAGWDAVFNAPKSVSLQGTVGGDQRVVRAHEVAALRGAAAMQEYAQARGRKRNETTGKWIAAIYNHDTARPVNGYQAAHLHTHCVFMNMTQDANGNWRSLDPYEIFRAQQIAKAVYQSELAYELRKLGYKIRRGRGNAPEIDGFPKEYMEAESLRNKLIKEKIENLGMYGRKAEALVQHEDREAKLDLTQDELRAQHAERATPYIDLLRKLYQESLERGPEQLSDFETRRIAMSAVRLAKEKRAERDQVFQEFEILAEALRYSRGKVSFRDIQRALEYQISKGRMIPVTHVLPNAPQRRLTTPEAIITERETLFRMFDGSRRVRSMHVRESSIHSKFPKLNEDQLNVAMTVLNTEDQIVGVQGQAGTGKSTTLRAVNEFAKASGYTVWGLGPTGKASSALLDSDLQSETLAKFIARGCVVPKQDEDRPIMFLLDEASLASARQFHAVANALRPQDRLVYIGDTRQHQSVEAGRMFEELQDAGMHTVKLSKIVRQRNNPKLLSIVQDLAAGLMDSGVKKMKAADRITQVVKRDERMEAIATDYADDPEGTLVIQPDNKGRQELNQLIRQKLKDKGLIGETEIEMKTLIQRSDIAGADRKFAQTYEPGEVVWYRKGSKEHGLAKGARAVVTGIDSENNTVTVQYGRKSITYNPKEIGSVTIYDPADRQFAEGDRIQFLAPWREKGIVTRDVAEIRHVDPKSRKITAYFERTGRTMTWDADEHPHIEYAYAWTSHSTQSQTVRRVLAHIECLDSRLRSLINETLAYVGISRAAEDARIYTDSEDDLAKSLSRVQRNSQALSPEQVELEKKNAREQERNPMFGIALGA